MKTGQQVRTVIGLLALSSSFITAMPLGTGFTYQGRLNDGTNPAAGCYDLRLILYNADVGGSQVGPILTNSVVVSGGWFTTTLDFGTNLLGGASYWLEIAVRTNGGGAFTTLSPRQALTPAPAALYAAGAGAAAFASTAASAEVAAGVVTNGVGTASLQDGAVRPRKISDGTVVRSLNGLTDTVTLTGGANITVTTDVSPSSGNVTISSVMSGWALTGNSGTTPGTHFLGTTDNRPVELRANGQRALRLEPAANGTVNVVGGAGINLVADGTRGATIAGGGATSYDGAPRTTNRVEADFGTVGGGYGNTIAALAAGATIMGGTENSVGEGGAAVAIGGGSANTVETDSEYSSIGGGDHNRIGSMTWNATIGGGSQNTIGNEAPYGTIPGGFANRAEGSCSLAAGTRAQALHRGAFVWNDTSGLGATLASTNDNSWTVRASGGVRFLSSESGESAQGVYLAPHSGSWTSASDRNVKDQLEPVDAAEILRQVAELPLSRWHYTGQEDSIRHLGPMAQDFHAAFGVGDSDTGITAVDADGVALAAIQGLNRKVEAENAALRRELQALKARFDALEQRLRKEDGAAGPSEGGRAGFDARGHERSRGGG